MMKYAIPPFEQVSIAIEGSDDRFPVRRIYCVGRNYRAHAIEMGADPDRDPPGDARRTRQARRAGGNRFHD